MVTETEKTILKKLIAPLSIQCFLDKHYGKDFYCVQDREKGYFKNILTTKDIDDLLMLNRLPAKNVRVADIYDIAYERYLSKGRGDGLYLDFDKIKMRLSEGHSFILNGLDSFIPKLNVFSKKLGAELFAKVWTNVYITPPNSQAFPRHFDTHDVFVLQIQGSKMWKIFGSPLPLPTETQTFGKVGLDLSEAPKQTIRLLEGDCLYIPRGVVHEVSTTEELSIHITVGFRSPQVHQLVEQLSDDLVKELFFRKNLFEINQTLSQEVEKEFKERLIQMVKTISIEELMQRVKTEFIKNHRSFSPNKFINSIISEGKVHPDTIIVKKADYFYETCPEENFYVLKVNGKKEKFSFFMEPIITHILNSKEGVAIKELNGKQSEKNKIKLVKRLLSKGIFEVAANSCSSKPEPTNRLNFYKGEKVQSPKVVASV